MAESESAAVPLGDTPKEMIFGIQIKQNHLKVVVW